MQKIITIVLAWLLFSSIVLGKTSRIFSHTELRRRARAPGNKLGRAYGAFSYAAGLKLVVWLVGSLTFAALLVKISDSGWAAVAIFVLITGWLIFAWHPKKAKDWYWSYSALIAPGLSKILSLLQPIVSRIEKIPSRLWPINIHTGIYESEDLLRLIKTQKDQPENRIPETDLRLAYGALAFGSKKIADVMTPRRKINMVAAKDPIGPHLLDELHASGFSRFPVVAEHTKSASADIVGTLYLRDLINHSAGGKVSDVMVRDVFFVNETASLRQALDAFIKTRHHLLVVVNNFEEVVGVISVEDVIEQIFGTKILDEFDKYEDIREVAAMEAAKEHATHQEVKIPERSEQTVVE